MALMHEAVRGPVLAVAIVDSDAQAAAWANESPVALGASVWTADRERGERVGAQLAARMVWLNDHLYARGAIQLPWGGLHSSAGDAALGLRDCAAPKVVTWRRSRVRDPWWPPFDAVLGRAARTSAALLHGREEERPAALRAGAPALLRTAGRLARETLRR
jgi:Aldehyde dehydrogenase family